MLLFLFLFGLALGVQPPSGDHQGKLQRGKCPMFWYNFNGRCYKYVSTQATWADAELHCVSVGANLVSIHSIDEENFIKTLISNFDHTHGLTWIGLSDLHKEGAWMWSDGSPVDFIYWQDQEPNNADENEHCAHIMYNNNLTWNDAECSRTFASVCESRTAHH